MTMPYGSGTPSRSVVIQFQIGESVDQKRLSEIPLGEPLRFVRIERDIWTQALEPDLAGA